MVHLIDSLYDGDLLGVASEITIGRTAVITGDIWTAGGRLRVEGTVGDDVHFVGVSATISDRANFTHNRVDLFSVAVNTEIAQDAALPGDLLVYGYQARVNGTVGGDVDFGGEALIINGVVNGRVDAAVGDVRRSTDIPGLPIYDVSFSNPGLRVGPEAYIGGDLKYESASRTQIPFGVVQGQIDFEQVLSQPDITQAEQAEVIARILVNYIKESLRDAITLLLVGGMALWLLPNFIRQPAQHVQRRTVPTIGWGLIAFMLSFPAAVLLLAFSLLILLILDGLLLTVGLAMVIGGFAGQDAGLGLPRVTGGEAEAQFKLTNAMYAQLGERVRTAISSADRIAAAREANAALAASADQVYAKFVGRIGGAGTGAAGLLNNKMLPLALAIPAIARGRRSEGQNIGTQPQHTVHQ